MSTLIAMISGGAILFARRRKPEPMEYDSLADYCYWRLFMYDHFNH